MASRAATVGRGIPMQRNAVDIPAPVVMLPGLHHGLGPIGLGSAGADGDFQHPVGALLGRIVVLDEVAVDLELAEILVRAHVAAAAPTFVSDAKEADL